MKISEIKRLLEAHRIRLTKSLGQNFLHDSNQLRKVVRVAELVPSDKVLEIGPGLGPLTELLAGEAGEILAIEKDARLLGLLQERFDETKESGMNTKASRLSFVHDDALEYLKRERVDWSNWKLVSNLPYSVASPILVELAQAERGPRRIVVTLQLEVAKRLMARAGERDYGVLTLLVQLEYSPESSFKIPASCFYPEPDVDSACVCLVRRAEPLLAISQKDVFAKVVKRSFSQRRKKMIKLLKEEWPLPKLEKAFQHLNLAMQARAETISLEQFAQLTLELSPPPRK